MDSGGGTQALTSASTASGAPAPTACPRCNESRRELQPARSALLDDLSLCRCARCGVRFSAEPSPRPVPSCESCGLPFLAEPSANGDQTRCTDCLEGRIPDDLPEEAIVAATERETCTAVAQAWRCVSSVSLRAYLNRLAARVAGRVEGAPSRSRVVLLEDSSIITLALPSGLVLMSVGALEGIEDEAELAFVLGHELAHAAGGEAARRLVRLGLAGVTRAAGARDDQAWLGAVRDMIALGYGRRREQDADAKSLEASLALGYDPNSILRYLDRLNARISIGDPAVSEVALAHPIPADRMRRITKALHAHIVTGPVKVNREVFRRAAGHEVLASDLDPVSLDEADSPVSSAGAAPSRGAGLIWTAVGVVVVAALILIVGLLLSG